MRLSRSEDILFYTHLLQVSLCHALQNQVLYWSDNNRSDFLICTIPIDVTVSSPVAPSIRENIFTDSCSAKQQCLKRFDILQQQKNAYFSYRLTENNQRGRKTHVVRVCWRYLYEGKERDFATKRKCLRGNVHSADCHLSHQRLSALLSGISSFV